MLNLKKILIALGFAVLSVGIAFLLYLFFFRAPKVPEDITGPISPPGLAGALTPAAPGAPPRAVGTLGAPSGKPSLVASGGLTAATAVVAAPTLGAKLSADGGTLLSYDRSSGRFLRIYEDGTTIEMASKPFLNVENVSWAPDGKKAVMEFPDGSNIIYDFESQKSVTLPKHWKDFDFSPDGRKIVSKSIGADPENRWLVTVDSNGEGAKVVAALGDNADKVKISWSPNGSVIAFSDTGNAAGLERKEILLIGQNGENFKGLGISGMDFRPIWSPNGSRLLWSTFSAATQYKPQLWTALASGDEIGAGRRSFSLQTWADKCSFADEKAVYCAIPQSLQVGVGFQPTLASAIPDSIYRLDLETGNSILIAEPEGGYSIKNMFVSKTERVLYFTDNGTGAIHQIKLQ